MVVNCTGLGAGELFGDRDLLPLKGQLTVLLPQDEVDYGIAGRPSRGSSRHPRRPHAATGATASSSGGTSERGVWSLEPNREAMQLLVDAHQAVYAAMRV